MEAFIANPFTAQGAWIWLAALLTLGAFSFLYRDNPLYKFTEHVFVGSAAGYYAALEYNTVLKPNLLQPLHRWIVAHPAPGSSLASLPDVPMSQGVFLVIAAILCGMMMARLLPGRGEVSRAPLSIMVGIYAGLGAIGALQGDFFPQLEASVQSFAVQGHGPGAWLAVFDNVLVLVGLVSTLVFFYYSIEHRGPVAWTAKIGMYFLMVSFGASYGYTVMGRISLLVGRMQFLLADWLHVIRL